MASRLVRELNRRDRMEFELLAGSAINFSVSLSSGSLIVSRRQGPLTPEGTGLLSHGLRPFEPLLLSRARKTPP